MRTIIAILSLAFAATTTSAHAADYENNVRRQQVCENIGTLGAMYYQLKQQGDKYDVSFADTTTRGGKISVEVAHYGYYEAESKKDAFMRGWAKCMDSLAAYD
jgi:opacity protein-like surface antigen